MDPKNQSSQIIPSKIPIDMTAVSFTLLSLGGATITYQIFRGSTCRQVFSLLYFRKTKKYSTSLKYKFDRKNQFLTDYLKAEENSGRAVFVDGSQGIGKTSYMQILADQFSRKSPVLYISLRGAQDKTFVNLSNIATDIKYVPALNLCTYFLYFYNFFLKHNEKYSEHGS